MRPFGRAAGLCIALALAFVPDLAFAQSAWERSITGVEAPVFGDQTGLGVMVVAPQTDPATTELEAALRARLLHSGRAAVVMDDTALGPTESSSDAQLLAAARAYPVDVVLLLRTYPGVSGEVVAVLRVESLADGVSRSFRFGPTTEPRWQTGPTTPTPAEKPSAEGSIEAPPVTAPPVAAPPPVTAPVAGPAVAAPASSTPTPVFRLEEERRSLVIRNVDGDTVPWPRAYAAMGRDDLGERFVRRRTARTATVVGGAGLLTAGVGLLFVGLAGQASCAAQNGACGQPTLAIIGVAGAAVGLGTVLTGVLLRPHPLPRAELEALVRAHNAQPPAP